jgi:hypothetical protein
MPDALPLGLRNRLAELILDAFDLLEARRTLDAVASFCAEAEGCVDDDTARRLVALEWFEAAGPGRVRLRGAHRAHGEALCARARAAAGVLGRQGPPSARDLPGLLTRAAWLARGGLHFEVHELLEPAWMRSEGGARVGLQGLIQVAVALQHEANGNRAGALSLLDEGLTKLRAAEALLPLETAAWREALAGVLAAWRSGAPPPPVPPWPAPGDTAGVGDARPGTLLLTD